MPEPSEPRRRLTYVITSLGHGGAQQQVARLAERMTARGWDVEVVSLLGTPASDVAVTLLPEIRVRDLDMRRRVPDVRGVVRLARLVRRHRPLVVHSHMVHANLVARIARAWAPMPVLVCTAHNTTEGASWMDLAYRLTDRLCDLTTNVSPQAVRRYVEARAAPADRIRYVPNGLDVDAFAAPSAGIERAAARDALGVPGERFVWLHAGRHEPAKDLPTLFEAFLAACRIEPEQHLLLAGDGPERPELERSVDAMGLRDRVTFLGFRRDVPAILRCVDAFVMSSAWEGLPMVLLEAGASRRPTVATRVGGTPEVVIDGTTGLLVDARNPGGLADAMVRTVRMGDAARRAMGEAARRRVRDAFDLDRVVEAWDDIYGELLAKHRRPG